MPEKKSSENDAKRQRLKKSELTEGLCAKAGKQSTQPVCQGSVLRDIVSIHNIARAGLQHTAYNVVVFIEDSRIELG